jgi:hypothetical protein
MPSCISLRVTNLHNVGDNLIYMTNLLAFTLFFR